MGYIGTCRCEGYGFQAVYSRIGYINQSVWVQKRVIFFRKLISWLKILPRLGKQLYSRIGGIWEITLVQSSKIQLNQLWYRLRVPGSQRHIPTQKFLKYPPRGFDNARCVTVCNSVKIYPSPIIIHRISLCISLHSQILNQSLISY